MNWSDWLIESREENGFSIHTLSDLSGLASSQIHAIEQGQSDVTLNAIVKLCFAMGISWRELLRTLGITYMAPLTQRAITPPYLTVADVQTFLVVYQRFGGYTQLAKHFLYESFYRIIQLAPPKYQHIKQQSVAYDIVGEVIKSHPQDYLPLVYPKIQTPSYYERIATSDTAIMIRDLGSYIKALRIRHEFSLQALAKQIGTSHSALNRLERGEITRKIKLDLLQRIDAIFGTPGTVLFIAWFAEEFQIGIVQNRFNDSPPPPIPWKHQNFVAAETLIAISRWYAHYNLEAEWVNAVRRFLNQVEKGTIKPTTGGALKDRSAVRNSPISTIDAILDTALPLQTSK